MTEFQYNRAVTQWELHMYITTYVLWSKVAGAFRSSL